MESKHLNDEISSKIRGIARIDLASLSFGSIYDGDELDKDNVRRLVKVFRLEGCNRLNPVHFIPASISDEGLQASLGHSNLTTDDLRNADPPLLKVPPGAQVECLQGRHRVAALVESKNIHPWWTVRLYVGLSVGAKRLLAEDFNNEGRRSEGSLFLGILGCSPGSTKATRLLDRLGTRSRADTAKRLYRHNSLAGALRSVLGIPGQRKHFKLSIWKRILTENCDEEIMHYLRRIYDTFVFIMGSEGDLKFLDEETVESFECRAPAVSQQDDRYITHAVSSNAVLWHLEDESARQMVLGRLRTIDYLIPTIHTLQRDFYYLQQCTTVMRRLLSGKIRLPYTVQTLARNAFTAPAEVDFFRSLTSLYVDIMQRIVELSGEHPLLEDDEEKQEPRHHDKKAWFWLANKAREKGFDSQEISQFLSMDPAREEASNILRAARPSASFSWGTDWNKAVEMLVDILKVAQPVQDMHDTPGLTSLRNPEPLARRCGRQYSNAYARDRDSCTIHWFTCKVQKGHDITSLFVRRSVFHAFWGMHDSSGYASSSVSPVDSMDVESQEEEQFPPESHTIPTEDHQMEEAPTFSMEATSAKPQPPRKKRRQRRDQLERRTKPGQSTGGATSEVQTGGEVAASGPSRQPPVGQVIPGDTINRSSQLTTFISAPLAIPTASQLVQFATGDPNDQMTICLRKGDDWMDAGRCRRSSILKRIAEVRHENRDQELHLFNAEGRGIALEDCHTYPGHFIYLAMEGGPGLPVIEIE